MTLAPEKKRILVFLYQSGIFVICLVSVIFGLFGAFRLIDLEEQPYFAIDMSITAILWVELLIKFFMARRKGEYLRESFLELISILPFSPEFAILHIFRILRIVRMVTVFPALPRFLKRKLRRARFLLYEIFGSRHLIYALMAGILVLVTTVYILDLSLSLPYFEALRVAAISCFSFRTAKTQAKVAAGIFLAILLIWLVWTGFAAQAFAKRFSRVGRAVRHSLCFAEILPQE